MEPDMKKELLKNLLENLMGIIVSLSALTFSSCVKNTSSSKLTIDYKAAKELYGQKIKITPMDSSVTIEKNLITIAPGKEDVTYEITGYFNGQIINKTKDTTIRLNNAYLENTSGLPALKSSSKFEVSSVNGSTNYIVSSGRNYSKVAALQGKRGLVLGGSGNLYVVGNVCHGVEAEEVKIKGTGTFYLQGTKSGSALTCETFTVEQKKDFKCYLINSKNGIKADGFINISSGNYYLYDNEIALKTEIAQEAGDKHHSITLAGGTFYTCANKTFYVTEKEQYYPQGAVFIEED
jgi:glucan-binding YG repeat protein